MIHSQTNDTVQTVQIRAGGETVRYLDSRGAPPAAYLRPPRHYAGRGRDYWSIGADKIERRRDTINLFVRFALEQGFAHLLQEVIIVGYDDEQAERYLFNNGGLKAYADAFLQ